MEQKIYFNNIQITNAADDGNVGRIEGYAAHWFTDNMNSERVNSTSFDTFFNLMEDGKIQPIVNYNHDSNMVVGKIDALDRDSKGLIMKAHINKNVAFVRDTLWPLIVAGDMTGLSTEGYIPSAQDIEWLNDETYFVKCFILTAVAITPIPADGGARFSLANAVRNLKPTDDEVRDTIAKSKWFLF